MFEGKTDKQLVWGAIKAIETGTMHMTYNFVILPESFWKGYPDEVKLRIRALLVSNGLISMYNGNQWAFQLTAAGMLLKESDLQPNGNLKVKKSYKQFWYGVLATAIGAALSTVLSAGLEVWKAKNLPQPPTNIVVHPIIQAKPDSASHKKK